MGSPTLPRRLRPGRRRSTIPVLADHLLSSWEGARTLRPTSAKLGHALVELTAPVQFFCGRDVAFQQGNHLCRNRLASLASAFPESLVEIVGDVFDVECRHRDSLWIL